MNFNYFKWLFLLGIVFYFRTSDAANQPMVRNFTRNIYKSGAQNWAIAQNSDKTSQYYNRIDVTKIAVSGMSCGGLQTLDAIKALEAKLKLPVTASSPAGFWDVMRLAGLDAASPGFGRLFATEALSSRT